MAKLWGGRFRAGLDPSAQALSFSTHFDSRLFPYDIRVNQAHVQGLAKIGVLSEDDSQKLLACLDSLQKRFEKEPLIDASDEDVHSAIERLVPLS